MYSKIDIQGFRCFEKLEINDLGGVNLFVGKNNSGKTSVLEAIELLIRRSDYRSFFNSPSRRGEYYPIDDIERYRVPRRVISDVELNHLFYGHRLDKGFSFQIEGYNNKLEFMKCVVKYGEEFIGEEKEKIEMYMRHEEPDMFSENDQIGQDRIFLDVTHSEGAWVAAIAGKRMLLNVSGRTTREGDYENRIYYISGSDPRSRDLSSLWDKVVLTNDETRVVSMLKIIEPEIERIALLSSKRSSSSFVVRHQNYVEPIPLASMGDGASRILSLALGLTKATNGFLLIDEIDTGLHHSVMNAMWKVLIETSKKENIQIFATTHSRDCLDSLADLYAEQPDSMGDVRVHRIEKDVPYAYTYTAGEIRAAVESFMEIR
jgi:AAA15 family ATPase/GTPase